MFTPDSYRNEEIRAARLVASSAHQASDALKDPPVVMTPIAELYARWVPLRLKSARLAAMLNVANEGVPQYPRIEVEGERIAGDPQDWEKGLAAVAAKNVEKAAEAREDLQRQAALIQALREEVGTAALEAELGLVDNEVDGIEDLIRTTPAENVADIAAKLDICLGYDLLEHLECGPGNEPADTFWSILCDFRRLAPHIEMVTPQLSPGLLSAWGDAKPIDPDAEASIATAYKSMSRGNRMKLIDAGYRLKFGELSGESLEQHWGAVAAE